MFAFEMCTGYNGKVWIKSERPVDTILIFNALEKIVEIAPLDCSNIYQIAEVKEEADKILASLKKK